MPELKFLDPYILAKLGKLPIIAHTVVENLMQGIHKSRFKGHSLDFSEHREYSPGDEIRHIDWKIFGKRDKFYIKEFEESVNLKSYILLDCSGSMNFTGSEKRITKFYYSCYLVASLAYLLLLQRDAVGLLCFNSKIEDLILPRAIFNHLQILLQTIEQKIPSQETNIYKSLWEFAQMIKKRALIILVSDLIDETDEVIKIIKFFKYRKMDVMVFQILDPVEISLNFFGNCRFINMENKKIIETEVEPIKKEYQKIFFNILEKYRISFRQNKIDYLLIQTNQPLETSLINFLNFRNKI